SRPPPRSPPCPYTTLFRSFAQRRRVLGGRPLLTQGEAPRDDLLHRFREHGNAVLLGTGTFWEGVDVRGPALTIVAIDKLPFASRSEEHTSELQSRENLVCR